MSETMARVLYMIGTWVSLNLGQFIFDQTVQHAQSHAVLKLIAYLSMLRSIMEAQHSDIVAAHDEEAPIQGLSLSAPSCCREHMLLTFP
ncbi:hypothetical protein LIER_32871 [Lithospermum erythrorhizon]|uniref:Uncharacterized protein n=1 Tax=Lithospermum erythrorhizon TaxID=34254 RepID=A0AAV3RV50_LITER